jgi:hypothetical protein
MTKRESIEDPVQQERTRILFSRMLIPLTNLSDCADTNKNVIDFDMGLRFIGVTFLL